MFEHAFRLSHPADQVLAAHRDGLVDFGPELPGVARVVRTSTRQEGAIVELAHVWSGDVAVLPGPLRRVVPADRFSWRDRSTWDLDQRTGSWAITIDVLGEGPHLEGRHRFRPVDGACEVEVQGTIRVGVGPDTELLGIRVGRWIAPLLDRLMQEMFTRVVEQSEATIAGYLRAGDRRAA